jgi:sodium/proline symporter
MSQIIIMATIIIYLAAVVYIGVLCSKKNDAVDDFYLGGRKLGPFVTAMSAEASDMSSWLLMGLPGLAYLTGVADAAWTAIGLAIGTYVNWLIVAKRIRKYTHGYDAFTIPDFFSKRFGDDKKVLTLIAAVIIVVFFIPYTASGFAACGKLFSSLFGFNYLASMIISAVIIVAYCTLGGFLAASMTDLIQSIVMTIALVVVVLFGINVAGGLDTIIENSKVLPGYLGLFDTYSAATNSAEPYSLLKIASMLAWGLGYFGMPHVLLRFMAIEDENKLKLSRRVATIWVVISLSVAVFIGIVGLSMTKAGAIEVLEGSASETIIVKIAHLLSTHGIFVAIVAGIILAGILAATMSTADSQLLAAASSISQNIVTEVFGIKMTKEKSMNVARITVVIISIIAVILASNPNSSVFEIVSFAWAGFGATFGPVVLCALFWKRANKYGIMSGMVAGGVMIFVWKYGISKLGGIFTIYELLPAFIVALLVIIIVSYATGGPSKDVMEKFEQVKAK